MKHQNKLTNLLIQVAVYLTKFPMMQNPIWQNFYNYLALLKRTIFREVSKTTVLNTYNTLIVPKYLYGSENWTLTASQRRIIEAVEMKLLRSLADYNLHDHKTKDFICRELKITGILDTIDEYRLNWYLHLQIIPQNRIL